MQRRKLLWMFRNTAFLRDLGFGTTERQAFFRPRMTFEALEQRSLLATVSWASAVDGNWPDPTKWDTGNVPVASDDVVIDATSSMYTVTLDVDVTAASALDSFTLNSTDAVFQSSNHTITVNGPSTISAGSVTWNRPIRDGTGALTNQSTVRMLNATGAPAAKSTWTWSTRGCLKYGDSPIS